MKKQMLKSVLMVLVTTSSAWAGKFEIIGEGVSSKSAEYIRLNINILSECHARASQARLTVDELASQTVTILNKFKTDIHEQLVVSPDGNSQSVKSAYINNKNVVICDEAHSWTSATTIQFKLMSLLQLAQLQDELLKLNPVSIPEDQVNTERLTLTLSKPVGGVFADTWDVMNDTALQRAHENALRQVKILTLGMLNSKVQLVKVSPTSNVSGQVIYDRVDSEGDSSGASLGKVSVKLARQFVFSVSQ